MQSFRAMLFVALLGISMVPFIVAPPESDEVNEVSFSTTTENLDDVNAGHNLKKSFSSGQAELQQAIDNVSSQEDDHTYERTARLLDEALEMLKQLHPYQRKYWHEVFTHFLQNMLNRVKGEKQEVEKEYKQLSNETPESTVNGNQQKSPSLPQFFKESPLLPTEIIPGKAVPETTHQQTVQEILEAQSTFSTVMETRSTLPKKEQDIPILDEEEATTTVTTSTTTEDPYIGIEEDELVRQLKALHELYDLKPSSGTQVPFVNPLSPATTDKQLDPATTIEPLTPSSSVKRSSFVTDYQAASDESKRRIEMNMAKEVRELRRLGANQEEINIAMGVNRQESSDGLNLVKVDQDTEIRKVQDINSEDSMIYKINPNTKLYTSPYPPKPYRNDSFEGMHINLPSMNERVVTNQMQGGYRWVPFTARMRTDTRNIQNTLHRLQKENYLLKTQLMSYTRPNINTHKIRGVNFPGPNQMNQFLPRYPTEFSMGHKVGNPISAPRLTPYPYFTNSDIKNFTLQDDIGKTTSLVSKPVPLNVNSEFSDEMKRQLRDGKVILLSDSVVRSNFEPEKESDEGVKKNNEGGKEIKVIPPEVGETGILAPKLVSG